MKLNNDHKHIVGLLGPSGGGKSSLVDGITSSNVARLSFADYLKEVATRRGWNGLKDESGRKFLQRVSEDMKAEYGEDIFYRIGMEKAQALPQQVVLFDDMRFLIEISNTVAMSDAITGIGHVLVLEEPEAEHKWECAALSTNPACDWAKHRSETDWRSVRHLFPSFYNNKSLGLDVGIELFHEFVLEQLNDSQDFFASDINNAQEI
jgi:hypothetical protein